MPRHLAIYPGSFDPITVGHQDIVRRSLAFVDRLIIAVAHVRTQRKDALFTIPERVELIRQHYADEPRVMAMEFEGLLVDFARQQDARLIIRGLRAVSDFEYEFQMALMNHELWPEVETVFLPPAKEYSYLSASLVRQVSMLGGNVSGFVSPDIFDALSAKLAGRPA